VGHVYSCLTQGDYDLFLAEALFGAAIQVLDQIIAQVDALPNGHRALQGFFWPSEIAGFLYLIL